MWNGQNQNWFAVALWDFSVPYTATSSLFLRGYIFLSRIYVEKKYNKNYYNLKGSRRIVHIKQIIPYISQIFFFITEKFM